MRRCLLSLGALALLGGHALAQKSFEGAAGGAMDLINQLGSSGDSEDATADPPAKTTTTTTTTPSATTTSTAGGLGSKLDALLGNKATATQNAGANSTAPAKTNSTSTIPVNGTTKDTTTPVQGGDKAAPTTPVAPSVPDAPWQYGPNITKFLCRYKEGETVANTRAADYELTCSAKTTGTHKATWIGGAFYNDAMTKRIMVQFGPGDYVTEADEFQTTVKIPKASDDGVWNLGFRDQGAFYGLEVVDESGARRSYDKDQAVTDMGSNLQTAVRVQSVSAEEKKRLVPFDQTAEVASGVKLVGVACSDATLKVTQTTGVVCTARVIPDEAGLGSTTALLVGPTGRTVVPLIFDDKSQQQQSTGANGVVSYLLTTVGALQPWAESGLFTMASEGALVPRSSSRAGALGLFPAASLPVKAPVLAVTASTDVKPPTIQAFYCSQGSTVRLDSLEDVAVSCLIRASDDYSGIAYVGLQFVSPSRQNSMEFSFAPPTAGLGNPVKDVAFLSQPVRTIAETASVSLPPSTETGPWTLARATVADNAGNVFNYRASDLDEKQVQTFFMVQGLTKSFSIQPRSGSGDGGKGAGTSTSAAPRTTAGAAALTLTLTAALGCLLSYLL